MTSWVGLVHAVLSGALVFALLAALWTPTHPRGRVAGVLAAVLAIATVVTGIIPLRAWEANYRRALYLYAATVAPWSDRKIHFGIASCCFAVAAGVLMLDRNAPSRAVRLLLALALGFAFASLLSVVYLHARAPTATLQ